MLCLPDKFPGDTKKESEFKNLSEAYKVLPHKKERNEYDQKTLNRLVLIQGVRVLTRLIVSSKCGDALARFRC